MESAQTGTAAAAAGRCPFPVGLRPGRDPLQEAAEIRQLGVCPMVTLPGGLKVRAVVDQSLARRLLTSKLISRDARRHWPGYREGIIDVDAITDNWVGTENALNSYGPEHRRFRAPIAEALSRKRVSEMVPVIEEVVAGLLDRIDGREAVDAVEAFATQVPLLVTTRLLGIESQRRAAFRNAIGGLFDTGASAAEAAGHQATVGALLQELIERKRAVPGDDLTSDFIREVDLADSGLSDQQLHDQLKLFIAAGIETTVHGIGTLLVNLMTHPEQLRLLLTREATWEEACEESLRYRGPIGAVPMRFVVSDFTDAESKQDFTRGEPVLVFFGAAGRDVAAHGASADDFDITRRQSPHLAFGAGPHFCPGASLARQEIAMAVASWFERFPHCSLAVDPSDLQFLPSWILNGYVQIPTRLRTEAAFHTA
ncbi:cytochrome P450 [Streptomyces sp. WI04-05B]|uniref:cytochrome P450 n=1 Tax=Streptomyces TaxID=1883 RepID=UPI0029B4BA0D|nr:MULTISPECIES: cytochrome P450 [unclassified Streptomyces]MDX2545912.1 cytochrome P450 [Streptomyces sp. WI04-05B]MDX2586471.1 cytochrome P450 [Streptomyces sp. WI04-05A]